MKNPFLMTLCLAAVIGCAIPAPAFADDASQDKYFELAMDGKSKSEEAKKIGAAVLAAEKDADQLNEFAWKILTDEGIKDRDLDLGMKAAKAAYDACEGKSAAIVDTYARAFFEIGQLKAAIDLQKKALEICDDDGLKSELQETLKKYEEKAAAKAPEVKTPETK